MPSLAALRRLSRRVLLVASPACAVALAACGGDGDAGPAPPPPPPPPASYTFHAPASGSTAVYETVTTDDAGAQATVRTDVTVLSSDGPQGYTLARDDEGAAVVVDGVDYGGRHVIDVHQAADGALVSTTHVDGLASVACAWTPPAVELPWPLEVGQAWDGASQESCSDDSGSTLAVTNASVLGVETVAVAGGTYVALHAHFDALVHRTPGNLTVMRDVHLWVDTLTSREVKATVDESYPFGAPPGPHPVREDVTLISLQ